MDNNRQFRKLLVQQDIKMVRKLPFTILLAVVIIVNGCNTFLGDMERAVSPNQLPTVEFTNVPVEGDTFSYAPVIYWKGSDPDGFVELYAYADITDSAAILNPEYYEDFIPYESWVFTLATSDTVYLLTETGEVTEHVFYLTCFDDQYEMAPIIHRTFFRTNQPPNVPLIKWWEDADTSFHHDITVDDTLYCLEEITDTWPGLGFSWKSSDPDDKDLYTIPLEFKYFLEKVPHDTIWQWVAHEWSNTQEIQFGDLETGHYTFTVWTRDDGLEMSERPATATFDVYKPTFEQQLLLLNITKEGDHLTGYGNVIPGTQIGELYQQLSESVMDVEYVHLPSPDGIEPWKSFLGRFRLIILISENFDEPIVDIVEPLRDYVRIGGRLWVIGYFTRKNIFIDERILNLMKSSFADPPAPNIRGRQPDFIGATAGVEGMPELEIDTSKIAAVNEVLLISNWDYPFLPGVDILAAGEGAETVYYYTSYTDTLNGDVFNDLAAVKVYADTICYPPTPVDCIVRMPINRRILNISRIENTTRGVVGEVQSWANNAWHAGTSFAAVVRVSYTYGEPWSVEDTIRVDYRYQPTSEMHLRPCAIRYEKLSSPAEGEGLELRYRVAVFTFPLYYLVNSNDGGGEGRVETMFNNMLDWFYQAEAH